MRWITNRLPEGAGVTDALRFVEAFMAQFDTSRIAFVRVSESKRGIHGKCDYPSRKLRRKNYEINCYVPTRYEYPYVVETRKHPVYRRPDGTWPEIPEGCDEAGHTMCIKSGTRKDWIRLTGKTRVNIIAEAMVWVFAHEFYHFLRKTKQADGRNDEIHADEFADEVLEVYRHKGNIDYYRDKGLA